ncbi:MAG TPA: AAA family ATPase [Candidatus Saccharimonadia bacterium]|nr:AAA family ATPase [Candidatus Saccharimonadia bacterium]
MYKDFYGLKEEPFNITPDPRFLYWSQKHQEAFRHLVYGVQSNKGLAVLTGEPGTGKTAILRAVTEHLSEQYPGIHIAFLVNSKINVQDLFCLIFDEFGLETNEDSKSMYLIKLKNFLIQNHHNNQKSILILDEAQNFHAALLEEIRLLSNMETAGEKLLHIFLVGQPQLLANVKAPSLGQLKQRLGIMYNLLPLSRLEAELYIHKRLSVAGAHEVDIFKSDALDEIFACAKGFPRLINILCDNALLFGCSTNTYHIGRDIIRHVAKDMDISSLEEGVTPDSGLLTRPPAGATAPRMVTSPVVPPTPPPADPPQSEQTRAPAPQPEVREDADRIILRNTVFSEENYRDYWDSLLRKRPRNENNLLSTWKQAAERESRQRVWRFLLIAVALLGLLGGIVGEQLGLWSLRAVVDRAMEMVRQRVALLSGIAAAPEAGGGRDQGRQVAPLPRRTLPTATSGNERASAGTAVPPAPQEPARAPAPPALVPSSQLPPIASVQPVGGAKELAIKKVVVVRSGDTLSHILAQEYGEYTKTVVDLVGEANPGLRNIHFLEIGQRLILPERPE